MAPEFLSCFCDVVSLSLTFHRFQQPLDLTGLLAPLPIPGVTLGTPLLLLFPLGFPCLKPSCRLDTPWLSRLLLVLFVCSCFWEGPQVPDVSQIVRFEGRAPKNSLTSHQPQVGGLPKPPLKLAVG